MGSLSQLLAFSILKSESWENLGGALNGFLGRTLYYIIICGIGRIADLCQIIFRKFAGISETGVVVEGKVTTNDIVISFFESSIVRNIFFALLILAIVILLITTFAAVIRTEFAKDGNNNKKKVIKNAFRGLVNFIVVPVVCVLAVLLGNVVLKALDGAISNGSSQYISSQIFIAGAYNANRARNSEIDEEVNRYQVDSFGALLAGTSGTNANGFGNFGIFLDDDSGTNKRRAADKIDDCFAYGYAYKIGTGLITGTTYTNSSNTEQVNDESIQKNNELTLNSRTIDYQITDFYYDGMMLGSLNVEYTNEEGSNQKANVKGAITFEEGEIVNFSYYNVGLVFYYYDLGLSSFNYIIGGAAMIFTAWTLLITVLGLIKRLFMLTTLFVISAPICAIYPLDEGKALGEWRKEFIKEVLAAYSVVIVMNLFLSLLPIMSQISVFVSNEVGFMTGFANYFARVLIVLGGLAFFKDATKIIAAIIGGNSAYADSQDAKGAFKANVGRVAGVGAAIGALGMGVAKNGAQGIAKGGKAVSQKISGALDKSFAKKYNAESIAQQEAMDSVSGKAQNSTNSIGDGSNGFSDSVSSSSKPEVASGIGSDASSNSMNKASSSTLSTLPTLEDGSIDWHAARKQQKAQRRVDKKIANDKHISKRLQAKADDYQKYQQNKQARKDNRANTFAKIKTTANKAIQPISGPLSSAVHSAFKGDWKIKNSFNSYKGTAKYQENMKKSAEKAAEKQRKAEELKRHEELVKQNQEVIKQLKDMNKNDSDSDKK